MIVLSLLLMWGEISDGKGQDEKAFQDLLANKARPRDVWVEGVGLCGDGSRTACGKAGSVPPPTPPGNERD